MIRLRDIAFLAGLSLTALAIAWARGELQAEIDFFPEVPAEASEKAPEPIVRETQAIGLTVPARVLSVHDGDTLKVEVKFVADIRLIDCWAPEITGETKEAGIRSREHLRKLAEGKAAILHVPLTNENIGKATTLGRILGKVMVNGEDLSYLQVKKKMATKTKE